jgi:hypothetical protein
MVIGDVSFTMGLPGGIASMEDIAITEEGFVFGLSIYTPALCSFRLEAAVIVPINCITGSWSLLPYTGLSCVGGICVISGGEGGMTMATYDSATGALEATLACLNCKIIEGVKWFTNVAATLQGGGQEPLAALSTVFTNGDVGTLLVDLSTFLPAQNALLVGVEDTRENKAVAVTNYPLASAFYYVPQLGIRYYFTVYGDLTVHDTNFATTQRTIGVGFQATCLAVDEYNAVLVVGGAKTENDKESTIAVFSLSSDPYNLPPPYFTTRVAGTVLSVAAGAGLISYVTLEFPTVYLLDTATATLPTKFPTLSSAPSQEPSLPPSGSSLPSLLPSFAPSQRSGRDGGSAADRPGMSTLLYLVSSTILYYRG